MLVRKWSSRFCLLLPPLLTSDIYACNFQALLCMLHEITNHLWRSAKEDDWAFMLGLHMTGRHLLPCMCQIIRMHSPVLHMLLLFMSIHRGGAREKVGDTKSACAKCVTSHRPKSVE